MNQQMSVSKPLRQPTVLHWNQFRNTLSGPLFNPLRNSWFPKRQKFDIIDLEDEADVASQDATPIKDFACFDKNSFQVNSFAAKISMVFKQAWEKGKMNKLFGKRLDFGRTVPPVDVIGRH